MKLPPYPLAIERRVAFSQTDAAGLIHFSTYFIFMEAAEADLFRELGLPLLVNEPGETRGFPRVDCQCRFRRPVHFDEVVRIELSIESLEAGRIHYRFVFFNAAGDRCASGSMSTASATRTAGGDLAGVPLPVEVRSKLEAWKNQPV
jgi:YbgC/YbaW family acyl-CoA thioester hydrolase